MSLECAYGAFKVRGTRIDTSAERSLGETPRKPGEDRYGLHDPDVLVRFGVVGADVIADDDDVVIFVGPQNMVGGSIVEPLQDMVRHAEGLGKTLCLVYPNLVDRPSPNNQI